MSKPALQKLSQVLGYTFKNQQLLKQALTHRSLKTEHNERLEFLGDAVLGAIITSSLFQKYPSASEGKLSYMRATLVCEEQLAVLAEQLQLQDYMRLGPSELKQFAYKKRPSLLADALEAVIGAIYLDAGWSRCTACVLAWYQNLLDQVQPIKLMKDSKTELQEYLQSKKQGLPCYQLLSQTGSPHQPIFTIACKLPDGTQASILSCTGMGKNRREAEQQAAFQLLKLLKKGDVDYVSGHVGQSMDND